MALQALIPQFFFPTAVTQLPAIDFYAYAKNQLPQVYQNAPNFMAVVRVISNNKQYLYDVIRSLVNVYNLNNAGGGIENSTPYGVYLNMLASVFNTPINPSAAPYQILNAIQNTVIFVNSRGTPNDFFSYFANNGLESSITNENIEDDGNATIFFNVPVENTGTNYNPYDIFVTDMAKLKGAGIEVIVTPGNIPFFQLGSLPTDTPPYQVAPGNAGFGVLKPDGRVVNGGFFSNTIP